MRMCDHCDHAEAAYTDGSSAFCADCACWSGAVRHGERYAAVQVLGFAVESMRRARFTEEEIRAALEETLHTGRPPERLVAAEDRDDRWLRGVVPVSAFDVGAEAA